MALFPIGRTPSPEQRELRNALIAGGLILALFITVVHLWSRNDDSSNPVSEPYYIKAQKDEGWIEKLAGDPVAFFTFVLTGATVGLYLATRSLWVATERLVTGADITAKQQLRAYVGIESAVITKRKRYDIPVEVTVVVKNYGATPAYNCVIDLVWTHRGIQIHPDKISDYPLVTHECAITLMPGAVRTLIRHNSENRYILSSTLTGKIKYSDAFKEGRFTDFRLNSRTVGDSFWAGEYGNDSD